MKNILTAKAGVCLLVLTLCACHDIIEKETAQPLNSSKLKEHLAPEEAFPGKQGTLKTAKLYGQDITYSEIDGQAVFEGDIILSPAQLNAANVRTDGAGTDVYEQLWPNGIIYYSVDPSVSSAFVEDAIKTVEEYTPVKFVRPRKGQTNNFVTFKRGIGLSSSVGMVGGEQFITVTLFSSKGQLMHEILHTLGMFHEHTRQDRDNMINIKYENIKDGSKFMFDTYAAQGLKGFEGRFGFDITSIMMLDSYAFSKNGQPTMVLKKDGMPFTVQRDDLAVWDRMTILGMYTHMHSLRSGEGYLDQVDIKDGRFYYYLSDNVKQVDAMIEDAKFIYIVSEGLLKKMHAITGKATTLTIGLSGTQVMAGFKNSDLFLIHQGILKKVNTTTGAVSVIGKQVWLNARAMAYLNGFLYIVSEDYLYKVNPETSVAVSMGGGFNGIAELLAMKGSLYSISGSGIYKIHPSTGYASIFEKFAYTPTAQLAGFNGKLYVTDDRYIYEIDQNGNKKTLDNYFLYNKHLSAYTE